MTGPSPDPLRRRARCGVFVIVCLALAPCAHGQATGLFMQQADVGEVRHAGAVGFDEATGTYRVTGSGANIWGTEDAFFFTWRPAAGDLALTADVAWEGSGKDPHRKAGWMIRAGLAPGAPYVDAVVHGDGLIALQYRAAPGGPTQEVQSPVRAPARLLLERHGDLFSLSVARPGGAFQPVGSLALDLPEDVLAGLAVSAHDASVSETALFTNVGFEARPAVAPDDRVVESTLEIIDVETQERRVVYRAKEHFEAPNWSRDGTTLLFNSRGRLYTIPVAGGTPQLLDTGSATRCNNDHGYAPDGQTIVISHGGGPDGQSLIYTLPATGGEPRLVTPLGPSYWHGWSPDGKTLAYCARRDGEYDVYTIPATGGPETRLTTAPGLDDGPDYSPDGQYIFFNSVRTGQMKIWRMNADGTDQVQVTPDDDYGDWFAHPSPDGRWIVFVSYDRSVEGHPPNKNVVLRLMPMLGGAEPRVIATLFGGQGTINVPSWSPDSREVAFVSYRLVAP